MDIDFSTVAEAEGFLTVLRDEVWPSPDRAPAKIGTPSAQVIDMVGTTEYG